MTSWRPADINAQLDRFGVDRARKVATLAHHGNPDGIGPALILAIGSRETGLRNIVGDGGHGRGFLQIDDRAHGDWLSSHDGCRDGTWTADEGHRAGERGYVPTLTGAVTMAIELLHDAVFYGHQQRIPPAHLLRFAVAAYNAGAGNALTGYRRQGLEGVDLFTTGADYSRDVLARLTAVDRWLTKHNL